MSMSMCPHCGRRVPSTELIGGRLVPIHAYGLLYCPGSEQNPRNPETDKRPLWKDEKKEKT